MPEAIPLLLRSPKAMALAVLIVCLSLSGLIIWQLEQNQRHARRADVENIAQNHAFLVRDSLNQALTLNYSFAAMVRLGRGSTLRFEDAARELLPYFDSVSHISLSPNGIITQVYPLKGNEASLGFNQLADVAQNKEAIRARLRPYDTRWTGTTGAGRRGCSCALADLLAQRGRRKILGLQQRHYSHRPLAG